MWPMYCTLFSILVDSDFNKHFGEFTVDETHCLNVVMYVRMHTYIYIETIKDIVLIS